LSSELAQTAAFSFEQLDAPPPGSGNIGDVLSAAIAEAEQVRERARAAGEAEGRAAGIAAARGDIELALRALGHAVAEVEGLRSRVAAEAEGDAIELAFRLSEQILAGVLSVEHERVIDVARNALRHLTERRRVTLVVNPDDLAVMSDSVEPLVHALGGIEHLAVQADRRVGRGGVVARTDAGEIDVGIDVQLARAREIVAAALAPAAPASGEIDGQ
jgi:flagellar assembly protein FliH